MRDASLAEQLPEGAPEAPVSEYRDQVFHGGGLDLHDSNAFARTGVTMGDVARCIHVALYPLLLASAAAASGACAHAAPDMSPGAAPAAGCPVEGCAPRQDDAGGGSRLAGACDAEAPCGGAAPDECTSRALAAWSQAQDDRALACVVRMLDEACSLGDAEGCAFAGRMHLDGRGTERDLQGGIDRLIKACEGGVKVSCMVGIRTMDKLGGRRAGDVATLASLVPQELREIFAGQYQCLSGEAEMCATIAVNFHYGRSGFPRDLAKADAAYMRGCALGSALACNNLADALYYGDGAPRDSARACQIYDRACRLGEALGCGNLGFCFERGDGVTHDAARARELYRQSCTARQVYSCLHLDMMAVQGAGAPSDVDRALDQWQKGCEQRREAKSCAYAGVLFEDGTPGTPRDERKSYELMSRACELGDKRGCEWTDVHENP
jgi:TPR repeat protein